MRIAQITDLHICPKGMLAYGVSETTLSAEHAVHALLRQAPDCVLVTGDLTQNGLAEEYAIAAELFDRLPCPVYIIPGNHDRREALRSAFAHKGYLPASGPLNYVAACQDVRIVALDSLEEGTDAGALADETLDFLAATLSEARAQPTLVMLHHPPFRTGIGHMDAMRLIRGATEFERIIAANPQVERVLCGHVHRAILRMFGGTICQIAPSVAHQIALDPRPDATPGFVLEPPAYLLHIWEDGAIVTHTVPVDRAPGPFPFAPPPAS